MLSSYCKSREAVVHSLIHPFELLGFPKCLAGLLSCLCLGKDIVSACCLIFLDKAGPVITNVVHNSSAQGSFALLSLGTSIGHFHFADDLPISLVSWVVIALASASTENIFVSDVVHVKAAFRIGFLRDAFGCALLCLVGLRLNGRR